jgi:ketosteroid isomerase-like protein
MSQENVEIVRRGYDAFNRGDLEAMAADFASNFEYVTTGAVPGMTGVYQGPEGLAEFLEWMRSEFESPRIDVRELSEAGDQVLAAVTLGGRGKQSGVEASWDIWHLWTVEHGRVVRGHAFTSMEEALEVAGLRE